MRLELNEEEESRVPALTTRLNVSIRALKTAQSGGSGADRRLTLAGLQQTCAATGTGDGSVPNSTGVAQ